jgi:3-methyladenine DNA glycosylase AlkD
MDLATAVAELEAAGTEQNRTIYRRHGARDPMFGVSFAVLDRLAQQAKRDQALADGLWATGNADCRVLACKVADPATFDEAKLDAWLAEIDDYGLVDIFSGAVACRVPGVRERADRWAASDRDWTADAGWHLYTHLALADDELDDGYFEQLLARIERDLPGSGNRTRYAMNSCVIAIGGRNEALRSAAEAAAARIGTVKVDHGDTGCKTPAAIPYIARMWDRKRARPLAVKA